MKRFTPKELPDLIHDARIATAKTTGDDFVKSVQTELDSFDRETVKPRTAKPKTFNV